MNKEVLNKIWHEAYENYQKSKVELVIDNLDLIDHNSLIELIYQYDLSYVYKSGIWANIDGGYLSLRMYTFYKNPIAENIDSFLKNIKYKYNISWSDLGLLINKLHYNHY